MKKISVVSIIIGIVIVTTFVNYLIYNQYFNKKVIDIAYQIVEENEEVQPNEIAKILLNPKNADKNILKEYGYNVDNLYLVGDIQEKIIINIIINVIIVCLIMYIDLKKKKQKRDEIDSLITFLEKINSGDYNINLNKYNESDFSKLRNEIFKTTVHLKEHAEYLNNEKILLKNNLADVSHQMRTPLTSINLMIESIIEDKTMSETKKEEFLNKIYSQTEKISYLIEALLKISKFDASVIEFKEEKVLLYNLLEKVKESLEVLIVQKNITININIDKNIEISCDKKWEEEAISNIVKNCIEYSHKDGIIDINAETNNFYTLLTIKDYGEGISKDELKKVFVRFQKNRKSKGFGIGLNLAKTIIEKDNGIIDVKSVENEYTKFIIKYIK